MKKTLVIIIVSVLIILVLGGVGAYFYFGVVKTTPPKTEATSDDGFASLSATFYDDSASSGGTAQALIGGTTKKTGVIFIMKASNPSATVPLTSITLVSPSTYMGTAFSNKGAFTPLPSLPVSTSNIVVGTTGQTCTVPTQATDCDTNEYCSISAGNKCAINLDVLASANAVTSKFVPFCISLQGTYKQADGTDGTVTSSAVCIPDATGYDLRGEFCSYGTYNIPINTCYSVTTTADADKPKYCNFVEGSAPTMIDKSSVCSCPAGQERVGEGCTVSKCADNTLINTCSTVSHEGTYGAYYFCKSDKSYEARCEQCGATTDYYGNEKESCNPATTGVLSHAIYRTYTGSLTGGLSEG